MSNLECACGPECFGYAKPSLRIRILRFLRLR